MSASDESKVTPDVIKVEEWDIQNQVCQCTWSNAIEKRSCKWLSETLSFLLNGSFIDLVSAQAHTALLCCMLQVTPWDCVFLTQRIIYWLGLCTGPHSICHVASDSLWSSLSYLEDHLLTCSPTPRTMAISQLLVVFYFYFIILESWATAFTSPYHGCALTSRAWISFHLCRGHSCQGFATRWHRRNGAPLTAAKLHRADDFPLNKNDMKLYLVKELLACLTVAYESNWKQPNLSGRCA